MGSVCCCLHVPDVEEQAESTSDLIHGRCTCPNCCIRDLMNKFGALFGRVGAQPVPSSDQGPTNSNSVVPYNSSLDVNRPNNPSSGHLQLQHNVVSRRPEKGSSHSRVEPIPIRQTEVQVTAKLTRGEKPIVSDEGGSENCHSLSSARLFSLNVESGAGYEFCSSEEEDVCPTCLEEYAPENPKIITKCSHHYHLSCIYEWMERSKTCPVCGKLMEFDETS